MIEVVLGNAQNSIRIIIINSNSDYKKSGPRERSRGAVKSSKSECKGTCQRCAPGETLAGSTSRMETTGFSSECGLLPCPCSKRLELELPGMSPAATLRLYLSPEGTRGQPWQVALLILLPLPLPRVRGSLEKTEDSPAPLTYLFK